MFYLCSENKGAHQLRGYREADQRLCFRICKTVGFLMTRLIFSLQVKALSGKVGDRKLILINYPDAMGDNYNPVMDIIDVNAAKKLRQLDGIEGGQYGDRIIYKK